MAHEAFTGESRAELTAADLERLAIAAYMIDDDDVSAVAWQAARCAFWLALCLLLRGQMAQAGGWLSRTEGIIVRRRRR